MTLAPIHYYLIIQQYYDDGKKVFPPLGGVLGRHPLVKRTKRSGLRRNIRFLK